MIGQPIIGSHAIGQSLVTNPQHISKNLFLFITTYKRRTFNIAALLQ